MMLVDMTLGHLFEFRKNVREIDLEEVERVSGLSFDSHLPFQCKALLDDDGTVIGIGGVDNHVVWFIATTAIEARKIKFLRFSKRYLQILLDEHGYLTNVAYKKNQLHIDWLTWLGAEWYEQDEEFVRFILKRKE